MNDETCPHGRQLGLKCIFCGGAAKPSKRQVAKPPTPPTPGPPPSAGARLPAKGLTHRPADPPRTGPLTKDAAAKALRRAEAVDRERARRPRKEPAPLRVISGPPDRTEHEDGSITFSDGEGAAHVPADLVPPSQVLEKSEASLFLDAGPKLLAHLDALIELEGYGETRGEVALALVWRSLETIGRLRQPEGG